MDFKTIKEALGLPKGRFFTLTYDGKEFENGDGRSFFRQTGVDDNLTFDIGNNKALASLSYNGALKTVTYFRGCFPVDAGPGFWLYKDYSRVGPFSFSLRLGSDTFKLPEAGWPYRTSFLDNIFPITEFTHEKMKVTLLLCAPISADGSRRLRGVIYGAYVENTSPGRICGSVILPELYDVPPPGVEDFCNTNSDAFIGIADETQAAQTGMSLDDDAGFFTSYDQRQREVGFDLAPGGHIWVPVFISASAEMDELAEVRDAGTPYWLNETRKYYKGLSGTLEMPGDEYNVEFFHRAVYQTMQVISYDSAGNIAGTDNGTNVTASGYGDGARRVWLKDSFYYFMPFCMFDPDIFAKSILFYQKYSVRPPGIKFQGGISHSLTISLAPVINAGLYYTHTGDKDFFINNPSLKETFITLLEGTVKTRQQEDVWLFPSKFISDLPAYGDYNTSCNLMAWYSFKQAARIMAEAYGDMVYAERYSGIADRVKADLDARNIIDGPFGRQYIEGVDTDGTVPKMIHECEESDTTIMPFYGYLEYDDEAYKNYSRFAMSGHNAHYNPELKGIGYGPDSGAIFSGYNTGLSNVVDRETMNGENGNMTELRRLADFDGSFWWYPYQVGECEYTYNGEVRKETRLMYGRVRRGPCKCVWGKALYLGLFVPEFLGIKYDAPTRTLRFRPFSPSGDFTWRRFTMGRDIFDVEYKRNAAAVSVAVSNKNSHGVCLKLEVQIDEKQVVN